MSKLKSRINRDEQSPEYFLKPKITHGDFSVNPEFKDYDDSIMIEYLNHAMYEDYTETNKSGTVTVDTEMANRMFLECYDMFKCQMDSVEIYSTLLFYYNFDSKYYFEKLTRKLRLLLVRDLKTRIDINIPDFKKLDEKLIQRSFNLRLKNFNL